MEANDTDETRLLKLALITATIIQAMIAEIRDVIFLVFLLSGRNIDTQAINSSSDQAELTHGLTIFEQLQHLPLLDSL